MRHLHMTHPATTVCGPNPLYRSCGCGAALTPLSLRTIDRPKHEAMALIDTCLATGHVVTTLSVIGMTIVKGR